MPFSRHLIMHAEAALRIAANFNIILYKNSLDLY